mgnify:CR=1 FL=1
MEEAKKELEDAIHKTIFSAPICPIYQNVNGLPFSSEEEIKNNSDIICHAKTTYDILSAKKNSLVAVIFGVQNSAPIANDIFLIEKFSICLEQEIGI